MPQAIDVLLPLPLPAFTFLAPVRQEDVQVGQRVVVPWQSGVRLGVVTARRTVDAGRGVELRHALHTFGQAKWLTPHALTAIERMARATGSAPGTVLSTLNPPGFNLDLDHLVKVRQDVAAALTAEQLELPQEASMDRWFAAELVSTRALEFLRQQGMVDERAEERPVMRNFLVPLAPPDEGLEGPRRQSQLRALEYLLDVGACESAAQLARDADVPAGSVRSLIARGYAGYEDRPAPPPATSGPPPAAHALPPLPPGTQAPPAGSGALVGGTRIARLAALAPLLKSDLRSGSSVIVLVPDQAQAARTAAALAAEMPVAYLTGEATDQQRTRLWAELSTAQPHVLVGTFLALLAPMPSLGRIVVLDAGGSAYKLRSGSRLLIPKAARLLAQSAKVPLTLTDLMLSPDIAVAVPAISRASLPLPSLRLHVADLSGSGNWPVHPDLISTLKQVQSRQRQAVVLAPRRGFSGAFGCLQCGWQAPCPNCDLSLRFHQQQNKLLCHQCGHEDRLVHTCPQCESTDLGALKGAGTEWIAGQLAKALPDIRVYRYDKDRREDIAPLYEGQPGVVVGTLAVLGLEPLPQLSLVGVTHFDTHLAAADYRAEEEATRTLLRLAELGDSRRRPLMVVQTHAPENEVLRALSMERPAALEALLGQQLERRKRFGYPPFTTLAKLQLTARDRGSALAAAQHAADALLTAGASADEILGPASAPVERVKGRFVYHVLVRAPDEVRLEALLAALPRTYAAAKLVVDVDPQDVGALLE